MRKQRAINRRPWLRVVNDQEVVGAELAEPLDFNMFTAIIEWLVA